MVDRPPWPAVELTGARPSGRYGPRLLVVRWGKEGGRHDALAAELRLGRVTASVRWGLREGELEVGGSSLGAGRPFIGRW
jgi:hypothetical protein